MEEPQKLGIEWMDGSPPTLYTSTARDSILSAILDIAQTNACRPIPVLADLTLSGDTIYGSKHPAGSNLPVVHVPELEQLYLRVLADLGKMVHPAIYASNMIQSDFKNFQSSDTGESPAGSSENEEQHSSAPTDASRRVPMSRFEYKIERMRFDVLLGPLRGNVVLE